MGREIRRVPEDWSHPKKHYPGEGSGFQPLYDQYYLDAVKEWRDGYEKWKVEPEDDCEYWEWYGNPPDEKYYRQYKDEDQKWWQVYETVSEGTPVTPPFATSGELIDYLVENGDFWDQRRGSGAWTRESAENFVNGSGHRFSLTIGPSGIKESKDIQP